MSQNITSPFSDNCLALLKATKQYAVSHRHTSVGTEHLVYAMCFGNSRAMSWIASVIYDKMTPAESSVQLRTDVDEWFRAQDFPVINGNDPVSVPPNSNSMNRTLEIARQIGSGSVRDGATIHPNGLIASEFLLAAMLLEGTGIGISILTRKSCGRLNSRIVCEGINLDVSTIINPSTAFGAWETFSLPACPTCEVMAGSGCGSWFALGDIKSLPNAPTNSSNWVLKDVLAIGEHPGAMADVRR